MIMPIGYSLYFNLVNYIGMSSGRYDRLPLAGIELSRCGAFGVPRNAKSIAIGDPRRLIRS
ncbi:MAG: hypothetical protein EBT78_16710 [Betaproteobacteria bacterium]|nr:hypothetical protein [Betaproteobacteria bacterium]NBT69392.1 hypothetical protein [Betaproteobacteria bacterium]